MDLSTPVSVNRVGRVETMAGDVEVSEVSTRSPEPVVQGPQERRRSYTECDEGVTITQDRGRVDPRGRRTSKEGLEKSSE